jgi:hypothetical protein
MNNMTGSKHAESLAQDEEIVHTIFATMDEFDVLMEHMTSINHGNHGSM